MSPYDTCLQKQYTGSCKSAVEPYTSWSVRVEFESVPAKFDGLLRPDKRPDAGG